MGDESRGLTTLSVDRESLDRPRAEPPTAPNAEAEAASMATKSMLAVTFLIVIASGKTLVTKAVFDTYDFPFPVFFSLLSCVTTCMGCALLFLLIPRMKFAYISPKYYRPFAMVTVLTAVDMGFTNTALSLLTIVVQQCFRASLPVAVTLLEKLVPPGKSHSTVVHVLLVPMTLGPILVTLGSKSDDEDKADINVFGLICQMIAIFAAAAKAVTTHNLIKGCKKEMNQVTFLFWLDVLMMPILLVWTAINQELWEAFSWAGWGDPSGVAFILVTACAGGVRAYSTNLVLEFGSALLKTAADIFIQSLTTLISIPLFNTLTTPLMITGIVISLVTFVLYTLEKKFSKEVRSWYAGKVAPSSSALSEGGEDSSGEPVVNKRRQRLDAAGLLIACACLVGVAVGLYTSDYSSSLPAFQDPGSSRAGPPPPSTSAPTSAPTVDGTLCESGAQKAGLPSVFIIGVQKAATSSLFDDMTANIYMPSPWPGVYMWWNESSFFKKEKHFFDDNWNRGLDWYQSHFPYMKCDLKVCAAGDVTACGVGFDATPAYLASPEAPGRMKDVYGDKLKDLVFVAVLRNPTDRVYSAFWDGTILDDPYGVLPYLYFPASLLRDAGVHPGVPGTFYPNGSLVVPPAPDGFHATNEAYYIVGNASTCWELQDMTGDRQVDGALMTQTQIGEWAGNMSFADWIAPTMAEAEASWRGGVKDWYAMRGGRHNDLLEGLYAQQLQHWLDAGVSAAQFVIVDFDEYTKDAAGVIEVISKQMGSQHSSTAGQATAAQNQNTHPDLDTTWRANVDKFYAPYNAQLTTLLAKMKNDGAHVLGSFNFGV